jgi:hypothetical protein
MIKFKEHIEIDINEKEYNDYITAIDSYLTSNLNEGILSDFTDKVKGSLDFIKKFAEMLKSDLADMLTIFKNKILFTFFSKIKWSLSELVNLVKKGFKLWKELHEIIAKYASDNKIVKWTYDNLKQLDLFLDKHPIIKKATGIIVIGFLIYQWTNMISFTGDIEFDFDQTSLLSAISGNFSLAELFASEDGIKMLMFIATKSLAGLNFPWPGDTWVLFALSIVYTVSKKHYPKLAETVRRKYKEVSKIKV